MPTNHVNKWAGLEMWWKLFQTFNNIQVLLLRIDFIWRKMRAEMSILPSKAAQPKSTAAFQGCIQQSTTARPQQGDESMREKTMSLLPLLMSDQQSRHQYWSTSHDYEEKTTKKIKVTAVCLFRSQQNVNIRRCAEVPTHSIQTNMSPSLSA